MRSSTSFWLARGIALLLIGVSTTTACVSTSTSIAAPSPSKDDAIAAELLFREANQLVEQGKCAEAIPKFEASERADHSNGTLYNLANAYECAGRLASAWKTFMTVVNAPPNGKRSSLQDDAEKRAEVLEPRLPKLTVVVPEGLSKISGLEVLVDDEPLPQSLWNQAAPVDPGVRSVTVKAPGKTPWSSNTSDLKEKDAARIEVPIVIEDRPFPKQRKAAIAVAGVGLGVGIAAIVTGGLALKHRDEALDACKVDVASDCPRGSRNWFIYQAQPKMNTAQDFALASTVLYVASGAALGTAAILWFTTPSADSAKKDAALRFTPYVAPGNAGATLHFKF